MNPGPKIVAHFLGFPISDTLIVAWVVVIVLIIGSYIITRNLKLIPGPAQNAAEMLLEVIENQIEPMLPGEGRKLLPFIGTIFLFVGLSNVIGVIPGVVTPTGDLNTTLGLALVVFLVSHYYGMKTKGVWNYLKGFAEPVFFLLPINVIGELAKPISHSFRLFGNIMGGGIILTIIAHFAPWIIPIPLHFWFDLFMGLIQALIFGMLAISYIAVAKS